MLFCITCLWTKWQRMRKAKAFLPDIDKTFVFTRPQTAQPRKFRMLRLALAYLAVAVLAILLVTGLPFGGTTDLAASEVDVAEAGAWSRLTEWVRGTNPAGENPIEQPASTDHNLHRRDRDARDVLQGLGNRPRPQVLNERPEIEQF